MANDKIETKKDELSEWRPGQLTGPAPDYIKGKERTGVETIGKSDILMPRLALAQPLSPQVTEGDPKYIPGLKPGDLFNSLSGQRYGGRNEPMFVQVIRKDRPRAMEFRPMDQGGGIIDMDVPLGDPRLQWGVAGEKPRATLFRDYLARVLPSGELIALSFKSSGIQAAKTLNGKIAMRGEGPIYAGRYAIWSDMKLTPKPHQIFKVDNAGWVSEAELAEGERIHRAMKDFDLAEHIDRDTSTDFDPDELERQPVAAAHDGPDM